MEKRREETRDDGVRAREMDEKMEEGSQKAEEELMEREGERGMEVNVFKVVMGWSNCA